MAGFGPKRFITMFAGHPLRTVLLCWLPKENCIIRAQSQLPSNCGHQMKGFTVALLAFVLSLAGYASEVPEVRVRSRLKELAGKTARDCGRSAKVTENSSRSLCATTAHKRRAPFFVQFRVIGTDAQMEEGVAFDSRGRMFYVGIVLKSRHYFGEPPEKIEVFQCAENSLLKLDDGGLTCRFNPQ